MSCRYLYIATFLIAGAAAAPAQEFVSEPVLQEQPSSWVSRLWTTVFRGYSAPVLDPSAVPLYLPPPPPAPCLIAPLAPIEDDLALAFETGLGPAGRVYLTGLTRRTARALTRFDRLVSSAGGNLTVTSAHRPTGYQLHLQQVWDKWMEIRDIRAPECESIRAEAEREFYNHGLLETQRPASFSDHTRGTAFDAQVELPPNPRLGRRRVSVDSLARIAGLYRPVLWSDPVHFRVR